MPRHRRRKIEIPTTTVELGDTGEDIERRKRQREEREKRERREMEARERREMEERERERVETETIEVPGEAEETEDRGGKSQRTDTDNAHNLDRRSDR